MFQFRYYIWNQCEKCIQIYPNMPSIGLVIREKGFKLLFSLFSQLVEVVRKHLRVLVTKYTPMLVYVKETDGLP